MAHRHRRQGVHELVQMIRKQYHWSPVNDVFKRRLKTQDPSCENTTHYYGTTTNFHIDLVTPGAHALIGVGPHLNPTISRKQRTLTHRTISTSYRFSKPQLAMSRAGMRCCVQPCDANGATPGTLLLSYPMEFKECGTDQLDMRVINSAFQWMWFKPVLHIWHCRRFEPDASGHNH